MNHYGTKLVGISVKSWFDSEVKFMFDIKERAAMLESVSPPGAGIGEEMRSLAEDCRRSLRSLIRSKRLASELDMQGNREV